MADFNFDEVLNRREVPALKQHRVVLGADGMDLFPGVVADMDFRVAPCITKAIAKRAAHEVYGYEAVPDGLLPALTGWMQRRHGWQVDPDHVLRAPNVLNTLAMAVNCFTEPGDSIIVQPPVFFDFEDVIAENGRQMATNPLILRDGRYAMDFDGLERIASDARTRMLFLCNPHNPVGRVWTRDDLLQVGAICRRHGVLVVSDEIHADITFRDHAYTPFASLSKEDALNSIVAVSPAKSFNIASCCASFSIVADDARRAILQTENSRLTVNKNNAFASVAMEAAYTDAGPWLDAVLRYIEGNLDLVRARLATVPGVALIEPEGTFLLWFDFRGLGIAPEDLNAFLRQKARWAIARGIAFGPEGAGFGRLNIACPRSVLEGAMEQLSHAVKNR